MSFFQIVFRAIQGGLDEGLILINNIAITKGICGKSTRFFFETVDTTFFTLSISTEVNRYNTVKNWSILVHRNNQELSVFEDSQ